MNDDLLELSMWRDGNIMHENCLEDMNKLKAERDEAREKAERYRLEANAMMAKLHESQTYANKLADGIPAGMLPRDVENLREANAGLADDLQKAERERDEARRMACEFWVMDGSDHRGYSSSFRAKEDALARGWDCFPA
jgi:chromosome segregation ATPase